MNWDIPKRVYNVFLVTWGAIVLGGVIVFGNSLSREELPEQDELESLRITNEQLKNYILNTSPRDPSGEQLVAE